MIQIKNVTPQEVDAVIIPVFEDHIENEAVQALVHSKVFEGKEGQLFVVPKVEQKVSYTFYMGLGKEENFNTELFRKAVAESVKKAKALKDCLYY